MHWPNWQVTSFARKLATSAVACVMRTLTAWLVEPAGFTQLERVTLAL